MHDHGRVAGFGDDVTDDVTHTSRTYEASAVLQAIWASPDPAVLLRQVDDELRMTWANRAFCEVSRAELSDLAEREAGGMITSPFGELVFNDFRGSSFPVSVLASDASVSTWEGVAVPTLDLAHRAWLLTLRPRADDRNLDELLQASEERFRALAERAPIGIFSSEVGLRLAYVNDFLADLLGVPVERLLGTGWMNFVAEDDLEPLCVGLQSTLAGQHHEAPSRFVTAGGEERWVNIRAVPVVSPGSPAGFLGTVEDVTEQRRFEDALAWQATHDPLTRLPNRTQLATEIAAALEQQRDDAMVLFFDLDDFKVVNDTLGHQAGDELLVTVATRLRNAVRDGDHVFRFGGDEFVVLSRGADDAEALGVANRLRRAVAQPILLEGQEFSVCCSVGVVRAAGAATPGELLRDADIAMYEAKRGGKSATALFDISLREDRARELERAEAARDAIAERRLGVEYQPVIDVPSGRPVAVEALLRWPDPDWPEVGATTLVSIAEGGGKVAELTALVIDTVCADLAAWRAGDGPSPAWVGVNLSPAQVTSPGMIDHLARSLVSHGLRGADLSFEISEAAWVEAKGAMDPVLRELIDLGARVVLDDVGASVSSLNSIASAPITGIKLDRTFFFGADDVGRLVVRAAVGVATALGLDVVVEGIEGDTDLELARTEGTTLGQGYAWGHPVIAAAVPQVFEAGGER